MTITPKEQEEQEEIMRELFEEREVFELEEMFEILLNQ